MENKTESKKNESTHLLQKSLWFYWLSIVLFVVGIRIILLYEQKIDDSWYQDLFVPIIVPILALAAFGGGLYYSISRGQALKNERIERLKDLSKNNLNQIQ